MVTFKSGCNFEGCKITRTSFGFPEDKPLFCSKHKEKGMINLFNVKCLKNGCLKKAEYGKEDGVKLRCLEHKTNYMGKILVNICRNIDCKTQPTYNIEGENKGLYCDGRKILVNFSEE